MKQIKKLKGAKTLSKKQQQDVNGGIYVLTNQSNRRRRCDPALSCCYHNGYTWVQGPPCF
ncbi:hypothetical protein J8L88_21865 [Aquimarina sp. MMG015]|uniref:hypothetical protein n=1 Tax=Aquimarina TaxID=290174 RepID=UPI0003F8FB99|nr:MULTISPECIES: hypothetical protein [Aquimarina]AXT57731.1 hypothetical protein D1815_18965 [Aquimarina sp. AD1]MBQ4805525.1 hypothetical protein [Aquimarina sp. MMG015]RKN17689.1 hypothetical protein D7035_14685 [Aquimarina sp. AD1]